MCTAMHAWWGLVSWIITDVLLDVHTLENCGCVLSPLLNIPYTHMEVFTSREKLFGGLSHSRPQDRMWDGGEKIIFFTPAPKKWWDNCKDQIPCNPIFGITTTDLISVFLGFFGHHLFIQIHRDEEHEKFIRFCFLDNPLPEWNYPAVHVFLALTLCFFIFFISSSSTAGNLQDLITEPKWLEYSAWLAPTDL